MNSSRPLPVCALTFPPPALVHCRRPGKMRDRVQLPSFVRRKPTLHAFKMPLDAILSSAQSTSKARYRLSLPEELPTLRLISCL
ncbi:hypothetical protein CSPX01_07160 [Colletotrichum filicis]|nr:hypothetical protein CSPX01_07160 [Colletotrichum filicis]